MKAPDKIIVVKYPEGSISDHWCLENRTNNESIEYIRKEALLEWAREHQEGERQGSYTWSCYQIFIDKLNEM